MGCAEAAPERTTLQRLVMGVLAERERCAWAARTRSDHDLLVPLGQMQLNTFPPVHAIHDRFLLARSRKKAMAIVAEVRCDANMG